MHQRRQHLPVSGLCAVICSLLLLSSSWQVGADSGSCLVLVTASPGGSVYPEGAASVPCGSGMNLTFLPNPGFSLTSVLVDGTDAGISLSLSLSPVVRDMTVHAVFSPAGPDREDALPMDPGSLSLLSVSPVAPHPGPDSEVMVRLTASGGGLAGIQDALDHLPPGGIVQIGPGIYEGDGITITRPLTLAGIVNGSERPVLRAVGDNPVITIAADGVTISSLTLAGAGTPAASGEAVKAEGWKNLSLDSLVITDFFTGTGISRTERVRITGCTIRNSTGTGISLMSSDIGLIADNTLDQCGTGISGEESSRIEIRQNRISACREGGIRLSHGLRDSAVTGNILVGNGDISGNLTGEDLPALSLEYADNVTVSDNTLKRNAGTALFLDQCRWMQLRGNIMDDNRYGFTCIPGRLDPGNRIDSSNRVNGDPVLYYEGLIGETIEGFSPASLYLVNCTGVTLRGLAQVAGGGFGFFVSGGSDITIENCSAENNRYQNMLLAGVKNSSISGSSVANSSGYGIGLIHSGSVEITGTTVTRSGVGIAVRGDTTLARISGNSLASNQVGFQVEEVRTPGGFGSFSKNLVTGGKAGLILVGNQGGSLTGNRVSGAEDGILLSDARDMLISENQIITSEFGMVISASDSLPDQVDGAACADNRITHNRVTAPQPLVLTGPSSGIRNNTVFLNDLIPAGTRGGAGTPPVFLTGTHFWGGVVASPPDQLFSPSLPGRSGNRWETETLVRYAYNGSPYSGYLGNYWGDGVSREPGAGGVGTLPVRINAENEDRSPLTGTRDQYSLRDDGYYLDLEAGWNFISTPSVLSGGQTVRSIFGDINTAGHSLYLFRNSSWRPVSGEDPMIPLRGYWVYSSGRDAVRLNPDPGTIPAPVPLQAGWNAIGHPGIQQASAHDALSSLGDAWSFVIGFDASVQMYEEPIRRDGGGSEFLYPSRGYWVYADRDWDLQPVTG